MGEPQGLHTPSLCYPISPSRAIIISQNHLLDEYSEILADESFVEDKNRKMFENASLYIFANDKEILNEMLKAV